MTMLPVAQPMLPRMARACLHIALRVWPAESLPWGQALAAELLEIHEPWEALRWSLGGLMLFARSVASHLLAWLKLPAGARLSGNSPAAANGPVLPRRSRLFTAAVLLAIVIIGLLPQSQEAFSTISASWRGYRTSSADLRALERMGARAEKENDARTLAFVAMTLPHSERATEFAHRAVALDPSLFWIDVVRADGIPELAPPAAADMQRVLDSDKGNAYPELFAARLRFQLRYLALVRSHAPAEQEVDSLAASDPEWLAHMDRAFSSPRYDSYVNRQWQLTREVWSREHSFSPSVVFYSLWSHSLPDMSSIRAYTDIQFRKAHEAIQAGHPDQAEALFKQVDSFGCRMAADGQHFVDTVLGLNLSRQATIELLHLYQNTNRPAESAQASQRIEEIAAVINSSRQAISAKAGSQELEGRAYFLQSVAVVGILMLFAAVVSLLVVELRTCKSTGVSKFTRAFLCFAADWSPVFCLIACIVLVWAFQPFAQVLAKARTVMSVSDAWFTLHHDGLFRLTAALPFYDRIWTAYHLWQTVTYALGAVAIFILFRSFLFAKRA